VATDVDARTTIAVMTGDVTSSWKTDATSATYLPRWI
jgi:hypothetical protein